jgi:phage terminase large subunit-like protein
VWDNILPLIPGYDPVATAEEGQYFDPNDAARALDFFSQLLVHIKGTKANSPFLLEPWQQSIVANLFGWKNPNGLRRYREAFIFVPRKNGKTAIAAGIALLLLYTDGEPGAEIYCAAADRDQANLLFDVAKHMVLREPELKNPTTVYQKSIVIDALASSFKAISSDANTKHGYNAHGVIVDELHAHKDGELVDVLETSTGSREQPLLVHITTSDYERDGSICNEKYDYAVKVRDRIFDNASFLPVIYECPKDMLDQWHTEDAWKAANPNLGVSVAWEYIRSKYHKAKELPRFENTFKRLHLNIRTGQAERWLPMDTWAECSGEEISKDVLTWEGMAEHCRGFRAFGGLDLSQVDDLTCFALAFEEWSEDSERRVYLLPTFWLPEETLTSDKIHKTNRVLYQQWAKEGWLTTTPGQTVDYSRVLKRIEELGEEYEIKDIAVDRWNAVHIAQDLEAAGFEPVFFGQGFASMSGPSKEFEALILSRRLIHGANPILTWQARVVAVDEDAAGNIKPNKKKSGKQTDKIDGIVASVMAIGRLMLGGGEFDSVYEKRGIQTI